MIKITIDQPKEVKSKGLKDGKEHILKCSNCNKDLCSLKVTNPSAKTRDGKDYIWRAKASCAYGCVKKDGNPEYSFPEIIKGTCHFAGCFVEREDKKDIILVTAIADIKYEEDSEGPITVYLTKKVN